MPVALWKPSTLPSAVVGPSLPCSSSRMTSNSSRLDLLLVCLGWNHCYTPLPLFVPVALWKPSTSPSAVVGPSLPHSLFCTTSNSSRLDSLSVCLGWKRCCTLLPLHVP